MFLAIQRTVIVTAVLCSLAIGTTANAQGPQSVSAQAFFTLTGQLNVRWGDGEPNSGEPVHYAYSLTTDDGKQVALDLSSAVLQQAGGLMTINGRRVEVSVSATRQTSRPNITALKVLDNVGASQRNAGGAISGSKPWITIACKFSDINIEPRSQQYFQNMYDNATGRLDDYWREVSYNAIDIVGSTAVDWQTLPGNQNSYVPNPGNGTGANLDRLFDDCLDQVDDFVDFSLGGGNGFDGINLMFNAQLDCCAWGGSRFATLDGVSKSWRTTWNPPFSYTNVAIIAHEMGHGFGLPHSNNSDNDNNPYDSPWDVMSAASSYSVNDPVYGSLGKHINSYHKNRLGWIANNELFIANNDSDVTVEIDPLGTPFTSALRMVRINIDSNNADYYTVEVREAVGNYEGGLAGNGNGDRMVIIHEIENSRNQPSWVVDANNPPANFADTEGVIWRTGETFEDAQNQIVVEVLEQTATGYRVRVITGNPTIEDSDGDNVADNQDNCTLLANADQRDTNSDGYGNACDGDLNNDCVINFADIALFSDAFLQAGDEDADLNGDGVVNFVDFSTLTEGFLSAPGPSGLSSDCDP